MARSSLSKSSAKLYLSRRAIDAIAEIILMGNHMAEQLRPGHSLPDQKKRIHIKRKWDVLRVKLAKELL